MSYTFNPFTGKLDYYPASGGTSIGSAILNGTAGSVLFVNPNAVIAQDNANFNYSTSTKTFGLGTTASATQKFTITDTVLAGSGSLAGSAIVVNQTWNTTGAPIGFLLNVTNTASNTGLGLSRLFDFQVGGVSKFFFDVNAGAFYYSTGLIRTTNNYDLFNDNNAGLLSIYSTNTSGVGVVQINITSGTRATVKIGDNVSYVTNATSTCNFAGLQVSPTCNVGASNSGGNFYGTRINPIFTATTGLTGAYIFVASASSVDKFQVTSTGLVNCLIDGNSLQVGSGTNTAVYAGFAAQRGFFGYDGANMLCQGGSGKAMAFSVNSNTFGSGTVKLSLASGATSVGIGGAITNSATLAGAVLVVNDTSITSSVLLTNYNAINTAGWGIPAIYASGRSVAQTAAVASVAAYTVGAADGSFEISANLLVTTSTLHNFTVTCTYTDEGNTSRTATLAFQLLAGTSVASITNAQGAVPYEGSPIHIRAKAATSITIATTGTFTTVTYNVEGIIKQMS